VIRDSSLNSQLVPKTLRHQDTKTMPSEKKEKQSANYYRHEAGVEGVRGELAQQNAETAQAYIKEDLDRHRFTITKGRKNKNDKKKSVVLYYSGSHGCTIRDALTGLKQSGYTVGGALEYSFFKVGISSSVSGLREPCNVFFDSPEQYELHCGAVVSEEMKYAWRHNK